ncbi:putative F-box/LRR-repeat protein At5g41630 [Silene latifolia]|uniref:putative F-box/LRR-repeat protein At5g41630 n=1 Tax=Silene latifolia TaxID=37657 RepID=UPI003D789529
MEFCPQKHICSSKEDRDRLSELPDEVIINILSCMPTIDAVRTVLLRRFGNLWTFIHTLNFDYAEFRDKLGTKGNTQHKWFCRFIHNVLMLHQNLSINTFDLCIEFDKAAVDDLREWFRFALDRQAKEIRLSGEIYDAEFNIDCSSMLPNLTSQFLVTLDLMYCDLEGELQVNLGSLKKLSLYWVDMSDEIFERFISGCPSLQELVIENPYWTNDLSFSAPNIAKLSLFLTCDIQLSYPFSLNFPNLKSLYLEIDFWELNIIDVSSVRDIYVKYFKVPVNLNLNGDESFTTKKMFGKLENIEVFQLSNDASKPFLYAIQDVQLLRHKWKHIVLELQELSNRCLLGIYHLMTSLKHLEELDIYTTKTFNARTYLQRLPSPYVTPQLKTITLYGYGRTWRNQLQLIEFLLKRAAVLDKLVIVPMKGHQLKAEKKLEFVKDVANFRRASPSVRVVFA